MVLEDIDLGIVTLKLHMETSNSGNSFQKNLKQNLLWHSGKQLVKYRRLKKKCYKRLIFL